MKGKKGFTIIEIVIFVVVAAVALVPLLSVFGNALYGSARHLSARTASLLAGGLMEEVTGRDFDDIQSFVLPAGALSQRHPEFSAEVGVMFVAREDFNSPAAGATDFKRVLVSVRWRGNRAELATVVARTE